MLDTLHMARGGSMVAGMNRLELFVSRERIKPFVSNGLLERIRHPIKFRIGGNIAYGFDSDTLIDIAEAVIQADNSGKMQKQQAAIAHQCRVITSSLTRLGLIALIDEATGYQTKRDSDELQQRPEAGEAGTVQEGARIKENPGHSRAGAVTLRAAQRRAHKVGPSWLRIKPNSLKIGKAPREKAGGGCSA